MNKQRVLTGAVAAAALFGATGATCTPTPTSDPNIPAVYVLAFRQEGTAQGAQEHHQPGASFTVDRSFLGANKADIRVYGKEDPGPGVQHLSVALTARGTCSTKVNSRGQFVTAPSPLNVTGPTLTENAPAGQVQSFLAASLDTALAGEHSCGTHRYNGMDSAQEFFLDSGTWTAVATVDNCCGGQGTGTFTIKVT